MRRCSEIDPGIARLTVPLPFRRAMCTATSWRGTTGWFSFDTGLALPDLEELFREELDGPVERIAITHFHPDHVWGGEVAAEVTGAPVYQGRLDYEQCVRVWGAPDWPERIANWFRLHGVPAEMTDEMLVRDREALPLIGFVREPELLDEGDRVDGWDVVALPGHADGHLGFAAGRRPRRGRPHPPGHHAGGRRLPGVAARTRSAPISPRWRRRSSSARGWRCPRTASRSTTRPAAPARSSTHHEERLDGDDGRPRPTSPHGL